MTLSTRAQARVQLATVAFAAALLLCAGYILWAPGSGEGEWLRTQRAYLAARGSSTPPRVREVSVAWACADPSGPASGTSTCAPATTVERCTSCHAGIDDELGAADASRLPPGARPHPDRAKWLGTHPAKTFGCTACHGGEAGALDRELAHRGLARLVTGAPVATEIVVPEIEARCAMCHRGALRPTASSPATAAWAGFVAATTTAPVSDTRDASDTHAAVPPTTDIPVAPTLAAGRALFRSLRCGACHASAELQTPATPLRLLAVRSSPAQLLASLRAHSAIAQLPLPADEAVLTSLAAHLGEIAQPEASTAVVHRASLAGSSADEGAVLFDKLACAACHELSSPLLATLKQTRTADWIAYFLTDPAHANPATTMPSLRLSPREAASLATHLTGDAPPPGGAHAPAGSAHAAVDPTPITCPAPGETKAMPRAACGAALTTVMQCAACHGPVPPESRAPAVTPQASSLATYGDTHDGAAALAGLGAHLDRATNAAPRFVLTDADQRALATFLISQRARRVRPDYVPRGALWESAVGAKLFSTLRCDGCHEEAAAAPAATARAPSLFGEGLRTRPQWLFDFLRDPARHAVRPRYHPEWAYRDLVPPNRATSRMPSYRLGDQELTELVHFLTARDGASYPYAGTITPALGADALVTAVSDLSHKERGACLGCHTVGVPTVEQARAEGDKLAPPLFLAQARLRPEWIEACILQPSVWVGPEMPALFGDALGAPLAWPSAPTSEPPKRALDQVELLRDLLLMLRERTVLPPEGSEGQAPALGLGD